MELNQISEITKLDILNLFQNGFETVCMWSENTVFVEYFGRLEELDFLKRLYDLESMSSNDPRFKNAKEDIWQHTINNNDYPECWVFNDDRFQLKNGSDEKYLDFLCEVFHPYVRFEKGYWKELLEKINELLANDGYEIYPAKKISNREVFSWKIFQPEEKGLFIPYSQRNKEKLDSNLLDSSIGKNARHQIGQILDKYNHNFYVTDESGFNELTDVSSDVFKDIQQFYIVQYINQKGIVKNLENVGEIIQFGNPEYVLDAIEFFEKYNATGNFVPEINAILKLNKIPFKLIMAD